MKQIRTLFIFGILSMAGILLAQTITNKPLYEAKSIKVVANQNFPEDLECEIFIGSKGIPYFRTQGEKNQVKKFTIDSPGSGPAISMVRREGDINSYILSLFTEDAEGKVLMFLDFNSDGVWDVKRTPTREQDNFIWFNNQWVSVSKINGLLSVKPIAEREGIRYEFRNKWQLVK